MVPILHPRLPEAARAIRLSRMMELTGTEKTAEEKLTIDQDIFNFARGMAPDAEGLEKTATGLLRLASSLCNFEKKAAVSDEDAEKLAAIGVIEDTLAGIDTKLAHEARMLNRGYGVAVMCDLMSKEAVIGAALRAAKGVAKGVASRAKNVVEGGPAALKRLAKGRGDALKSVKGVKGMGLKGTKGLPKR